MAKVLRVPGVMAKVLRVLSLLLAFTGLCGLPAGAVIGVFSEGEAGSLTTGYEAARRKAIARRVMFGGAGLAVSGFVVVYLIDRRQPRDPTT